MTDTEQTELTRLYGDPALAPPAAETLNAGALSVVVTADGDLRYLSVAGREVVRRVYAAVRTSDWGTVPATVTQRERTVTGDGFQLVFDARYRDPKHDTSYRAAITITGAADGSVVYAFDGEAESDFERNRIGVCVLHPASATRAAVTVTHTDGGAETGAFPNAIAPHQPFFDIAAIRHDAAPGIAAMVTFGGAVFEMEDQRNWLDASFKTYSTPLAEPFPVAVRTGDRVRQTVTVSATVTGEVAAPAPLTAATVAPITVTITGDAAGGLPSLGMRFTDDTPRLSETMLRRLGAWLCGGHFWVDVDLAKPRWQNLLRRADRAAVAANLSLYVCLHNPTAAVLYSRSFRAWLLTQSPTKWFLSGTPSADDLWRVREAIPNLILCAGSGSNFTELNRARPDPALVDGVFFCGNPQVHASDTLSITETTPMIAEAVRSAQAFAGGKPVHVGPLSFASPYHTGDLRENAAFGRAWYAAAVLEATAAGAASVTFGTVAQGISSVLPTRRPFLEGLVLPVAHPVSQFGETLRRVIVSDPESIAAVAVTFTYRHHDGGSRLTVYLANRTAREQTVLLEAASPEEATRFPELPRALTMPPFYHCSLLGGVSLPPR